MYLDNNIRMTKIQELETLQERKVANLRLASLYRKIGAPGTAERLEGCSTIVVYGGVDGGVEKEGSKLCFSNFCRVRFCPICVWRRTLKLTSQLRDITAYLGDKYSYIFLTLTVRNCEGAELKETIAKMQKAWRKFLRYKGVKKVVKGYYRGTEITHDGDEYVTSERYKRMANYYEALGLSEGDLNPNYDTFHPHYHVIIAVNKSYFKSRDYMRFERWREAWAMAFDEGYMPVIDVRAVKKRSGEITGALHEVAKYPLKEAEILTDDEEFNKRTLETLIKQIGNLRFMSMGGVFKEAHRELHLSDPEELEDVTENEDGGMTAYVAYEYITGLTKYGENAELSRLYEEYVKSSKEHLTELVKDYERRKAQRLKNEE